MKMTNKEKLQQYNDGLRECIELVADNNLSELLDRQTALIAELRNKLVSGGSGGGSARERDVNFYDYDGTLLYSYTVEEAQLLQELPPLPTQPGLICQGWNYDLETIKAHNRAVDVGATYITDDGKTRLYIKIEHSELTNVSLCLSQTVANGVTIDWGDGSPTETFNIVNTHNVRTHTYASIGNYVITLDPVDGCTLGLAAGGSAYTIFGMVTNTNDAARSTKMLRKVEIGKGVTEVKAYTFWRFGSLKSIVIPNSVTSIGDSAVQNCYSFKSIVMPNGVTSIGKNSFQYCTSLANVIIPNSVKSIGKNAFQNCISLPGIVIPKSVTSMGEFAFRDISALASVVMYGVTSIASNTFGYCNSLTGIVIPNSVKSIGQSAFVGCYAMLFYDFSQHTSVPTLSNTNAFQNIPSDCEIRVPAALYDEWKAATNWSTYANYIVAV